VLDGEEDVEPAQSEGVAVEQVAGQDGVCLGPQELGPGWSGSPRRWVKAGGVQDGPDGRGADLVAEAGEFAVDAAVPPGGVLGGQAEDQGAQSGGMVGRPGRAGFVVQRRAISWRCQRRMVAGVTSSPRRRRRGSSRVRAAISARSVQVIRGRGVRCWSTASWWRRTRISISLLVSDRVCSRSATSGSCWHLARANEQVTGSAHSFGHPHGGNRFGRHLRGLGPSAADG
jgi:hypothetical protein